MNICKQKEIFLQSAESASRLFSCWTCPKHLHWKAFPRHVDKMPQPPQLAPFEEEDKPALILDHFNWTPHPIPKGEPHFRQFQFVIAYF